MTFLFQGDQQLMFWLETEVLIVDYISWVYEYLRKKTKKTKHLCLQSILFWL